MPEEKARLDVIDEGLAFAGLKLPLDFITYHTRAKLCAQLDAVSVTCCWSQVFGPVPSPVEHDAYLVQFLRDQQDCRAWYLYLRPGESFIVQSYHLHEYVDPDKTGYEPEVAVKDLAAQIYWCAPTFESFAYRCWLESILWRVLNKWGVSREMTSEERDYLRHYELRVGDSHSDKRGGAGALR